MEMAEISKETASYEVGTVILELVLLVVGTSRNFIDTGPK